MTESNEEVKPRRKGRIVRYAAIIVVLAVAYVLSYAPCVKFRMDTAYESGIFYRPVDWMIDETPLRNPFLHWAELWGVDFDIEHASRIRQMTRFSHSTNEEKPEF